MRARGATGLRFVRIPPARVLLARLPLAPMLVLVLLAPALIATQTRAQSPADPGYSAAGLYNLANSYARAGKQGMAVLNYERAALLAPNDADIQANLAYARAAAHQPPPADGRLGRLVRLIDPTLVALIGLLGILVAGASLLAAKFSARFRALRVAGVVLGLAALAFTTCNALVQWPKLREAVVIVSETPLRVSPVPMGDPLEQLTEAATVTITAEHDDFVLVRTGAGRSGWVARADLAAVVPRQDKGARGFHRAIGR